MSLFEYIASDNPLKEVENTHIKYLSVNQALELGIEVMDFLLNPSFDRDKPYVVLWAANEDALHEIVITELKNDKMIDVVKK